MDKRGTMEEKYRIVRYRLQTILPIYFVLSLNVAFAQQPPPPTLDAILLRLESNLNYYDKQVPDFFCGEHVVSLLSYGPKHQSTVTDSLFRVVRTASGALAESHEIKMINGTPSSGEHIGGPAILGGVFKSGLDAVSLSQKACVGIVNLMALTMRYRGEV